jgi:hypothetical protein
MLNSMGCIREQVIGKTNNGIFPPEVAEPINLSDEKAYKENLPYEFSDMCYVGWKNKELYSNKMRG